MKHFSRTVIAAGILSTAALAHPASAEVTTADFDAKCVMILNVATPQAKPEQQDELRSASFYYLGRLDSRVPAVDLQAATQRLGPTITQASGQEHLNKCMALIARRVQALKTAAAAGAKPAPAGK